MTIHVTAHAIDRYIERIDGSLTADGARRAILAHAPALERAGRFGAHVVIAGRAKLVLEGASVVTVLSKWQFSARHLAEFGQ